MKKKEFSFANLSLKYYHLTLSIVCQNKMMQSFVVLFVGSVVADYPYYTDYNSYYNSIYAPTTSNISSRLHGIKRTWNPDGPFTFGLSKQLFVRILWPDLPNISYTDT